MKNCQVNKNNSNKIIFLLIFIVFIFLFIPNNYSEAAGAADAAQIVTEGTSGALGGAGETAKYANKIGVYDTTTGGLLVKDTIQYYASKVKDWAIIEAMNQIKKSSDVAYKSALRYFLNTLAYDTATYLATGDKGQLPMFETEGWGGYLKNTIDNTAGTVLQDLGKNGPIKFNLCTPNLNVLLKINLGLQNTYRPKAPVCTFSKMVSNWDTALKDKDFLPKFQDMFNPWSNDLGIALTLQTGVESQISQKVNEATQDRIEGKGWRPVRSAIEGKIQTPADVVGAAARQPIVDSTSAEKVYTGSIIADSIDVFINTLIGKLIDKWLKKGLVTNFNQATSGLTDIDAQNQGEGVAGAENRMRSLVEPSFKVRGDYDILSELTMCPDPNKAGPTNCVIDEKFRQAIEKRLTVKQAMDQGYLNANGVFGFTSDGLEPKYNEGYPYRSMLILRKFRILPVGWEVAAQKIKDRQAIVGGTKNLSDLVNCTAAWCAGLVDPNWVLKAEQNFCKKEGAGPEIISEQVSGEGTASSLNILRNDTYCADEQSCVKEKSDGSCQQYGYCTEERRKWDFNGKSCEPRDNTCQTFQLGDVTTSYLQNTLDYGNCNAANAGCQKYATTGSYNTTSRSVVWDGNTNPVYLNKNAESCEAADQGCHGLIRITPEKNETYADIKTAGVNSAYNRFYSTGLIYEKLLPDYLKTSCYSYDANGNILDGTPLSNAPSECSKYARECKAEEAGCELYTNVADGFKIPAKVKSDDYCPAECVGYNTFIQRETNFDFSRDAYFIPKTAKTCSAEAAGCGQFTNLDEVAKGGEGIEYYTYLRQCLKKTGNEGSCGEFYNWEGSDESGYQLKVESLKASGAEPAIIENDSALCTAAIYNLSPSNPAYNADCRQFYNREGGISYHLYSRTISCSDNCHPYRKTVSADDTAESCKGGGVWDDSAGACIYMAVPGMGATCSATQNGCREYTGNTGNDVRNIFTDDFSGGTTGGWVGVNGSIVTPSSEALTLDSDNKGNSLSVTGSPFSASRSVGGAVTKGKSYILSFVAKAAAPTDLNLSLVNANGLKAGFAKISLSGDWQIFQTNLADLNHEVAAGELLLLEAGQNFYIDNITLTEVIDRYYLIKNSWQTPNSCDADSEGNPYPLYMLGCSQYTDRASKTHYLKSFSELCSESAVGCELMIDTKNSTATSTETFVNSGTTKTVPADSFTYVVYDQNKLCNAEAKGCELLGKLYKYENAALYGDVYLKNNPDKYNQILCGEDSVGCQAFTYEKGEKYFKDPGDQICEWRRQTGAGESEGWFKKKVKRCGSDSGAACLSDTDCSSGVTCKLESADKLCPVNESKTLGLGGVGGRVSQPGEDSYGKWAGICAAANSGCGEYIDPVSKFNPNLIFNANFQKLAVSNTDGWDNLTQSVVLEPNTVYRLARSAGAGSLILSGCQNALYEINGNNNLSGLVTSITVDDANYANSKIFYYRSGASTGCTVTAGNSAGAVELKKVVIDYQLAQNLDATGCNGMVDFDKGCVLFNQRIQDGTGLKALNSDADTSSLGSAAADSEKDSNIILKVTPDRTCDKWLACRSYIKDESGNNTCYDIGLCDAMDDKGDCSSFIISPKENQTVESLGAGKISDLSGYAKVGLNGGSLGGDYYAFGAMKQQGEVVNLANGGFEYYDTNGYPVGWVWGGQEAAGKSWDANVFSVINNPISAQVEGIGYAKEGRAFLKLGSSYDATSEDIDVIPDTDYIITAFVNTRNLKSGQAKIDIVNGIGVPIKSSAISQNLGNDWQFEVGKFSSGGNSIIKIKLYSNSSGSSGSEGNFYFDDIKIRPALNSKDSWNTAQSCRLYSKTDSMSCDYYEDSGSRQKGWYGYCLEYDRAPGNPNACILWYPVDKVKGDGIEEGAGYQGKIPVYYCEEAKLLVPLEFREKYKTGTVGEWFDHWAEAACGPLPQGYTYCIPAFQSHECNIVPVRSACIYGCSGNSDNEKGACDSKGWYVYDGFQANESTAGIKYYNPVTKEVFDDTFAYCAKVVQTVGSAGSNKYWAGRVYKGSDYEVSGVKYTYTTDDAPFGSIVESIPSGNPFSWDGDGKDGIQPLYVKSEDVRASHPYKIDTPAVGSLGVCANSNAICLHIAGIDYEKNKADCASGDTCVTASVNFTQDPVEKIKRLFAQSYGTWEWDGAISRYKKTQGNGWNMPNVLCSGADAGQRPGYPNDYCAILPAAFNIKINSVNTNVNLTKNGFVNLTFNTKVDSNQLPLVMYAIDWGDGEKTTVTGVEMRDRPSPDNPHSLYHLYSYWDLKAKANSGVTNIDCSTAGECRIKPKIQIKDNWGWCNGGASINDCGQWQSFAAVVVVKEK